MLSDIICLFSRLWFHDETRVLRSTIFPRRHAPVRHDPAHTCRKRATRALSCINCRHVCPDLRLPSCARCYAMRDVAQSDALCARYREQHAVYSGCPPIITTPSASCHHAHSPATRYRCALPPAMLRLSTFCFLVTYAHTAAFVMRRDRPAPKTGAHFPA